MPGAREAPGVPASPLGLTSSSIYSLQLLAGNGINAGDGVGGGEEKKKKILDSQHLGATVRSNVCFGNKITTYTVIHKYLHFIIASTNELASQSTQGWDSPLTTGTSCRILTEF